MKKHFTGIALFIFIVGISGFVASLFVKIPKPEVFEAQTVVPKYESKRKCSKKYRTNKSASIRVAQAVYNEKYKRLYADFTLERANFDKNYTWINLHFFIKTANETKYLTTEQIFSVNKIGLSFLSLNELDSHKNLYVIAELATAPLNKENKFNYVPEFDESKATAILVVKN